MQRTHVNLVDLVDVFGTDDHVRVFDTVQKLSAYTQANGKYFPRDGIGAGALLKYLLRQINNPPVSEMGMRQREKRPRRGVHRVGAYLD